VLCWYILGLIVVALVLAAEERETYARMIGPNRRIA
jgi:hypothetical protein